MSMFVGGIVLGTYCQAGVLLPYAGLRWPSASSKFELNLLAAGEWLKVRLELGARMSCGAEPCLRRDDAENPYVIRRSARGQPILSIEPPAIAVHRSRHGFLLKS